MLPGKFSPSATKKVSAPLPPRRFSIDVKVRVLVLMYCEYPVFNIQLLAASSPERVSPPTPLPMRVLILSKVPTVAVTVPRKLFPLPGAVRIMSRPAVYALRSRTLLPPKPSM